MLRGNPTATLVTVTVALFTDGFLYGVLVPLGVGGGGEAMLGVMYGVYALGVLGSTPLFGVLSDRMRRPWFVPLGPLIAASFMA